MAIGPGPFTTDEEYQQKLDSLEKARSARDPAQPNRVLREHQQTKRVYIKAQRTKPVDEQLEVAYTRLSNKIRRNRVKDYRGVSDMVLFALEHLANPDLQPLDCPHPCFWEFCQVARNDKQKFFETWLAPVIKNQTANKSIKGEERGKQKASEESKLDGILESGNGVA